MSGEMALMLYLIGAGVTYIGAVGWWAWQFGPDFEDVLRGAVWAVLVVMIYPLVWFALAVTAVIQLALIGWEVATK